MAHEQVGLLSGEEIKSEGLIIDALETSFRASTYDLSVGDILPGGRPPRPIGGKGEYRLAPGGTIRVVSRELLRLPDGITGYALPRNTLCTRGVLAINIGVVDPNFEGPISSTLINFGAADFIVEPGTPFLRLSFHRCRVSPKSADAQHWDRKTYVERAGEQVAAYAAETFLNLDQTVAKAGEEAFGAFKQSLILWATLAAVALALITVFVPVGASYADRYLADRHRWESETERAIQQRVEERYAVQLNRLGQELSALRDEVQNSKTSNHKAATSKNGRE
jgi:dUTPase